MNDLPPPNQSQLGQPQPQAPVQSPVATTTATDPKELLAQATGQIEATILRTGTNPLIRANEIHAIKAAYQKARYGSTGLNDAGVR